MTSLVARQIALTGRIEPTDLIVEPGELVAVIGPNGGGKTSLLRALARVEDAVGTVEVDGEDMDRCSEARRQHLLAFLPASRDVRWPIAVRQVIALGLDRPDTERIDELIELFELTELSNRPSDRLSTGERARVLMARALAARPKLLLLDEPLGNLDPYWVLRFLDLFAALRDEGAALLVSLHDLAHLDRFDRVLMIDQGTIKYDGPPEVLSKSNLFEQIFRVGWKEIRPADRRSSR